MLRKIKKIVRMAKWRLRFVICFIFGHNPVVVGDSANLDENFNPTKRYEIFHCKRCDSVYEREVH